MNERLEFVRACLDRRQRIVDICERFGISEKTGHKMLQRFRLEGEAGLADRSHAPQHQPHRMSAAAAARIIHLRKKHPLYGAAKLRDWLVQREPETSWPAASSIGALLARHGLIRVRRRRHGPQERAALDHSRTAATAPNVVWTADFKGQFRLGHGSYCYPLTVLDLASHYALGCTALPSTAVAATRHAFTRLFREYGLPTVLRTDNGVPFAQPNAVGRLGALALWWVRLGIRPEHTKPATPSDNGAHERFHKTLKAAAIRPPAASLAAQQRRFDAFCREYNTERPHQSLPKHVPPTRCYVRSTRPYPERLPPLLYPESSEVRLVTSNGHFKWRNTTFFLSSNLVGEYVSLTETDGDLVTVAYGALALGDIEPHHNRFVPRARWVG